MRILVVLLLSAVCAAQSYPDAPSQSWMRQKKQSGWTRWDGQPSRTNRQIVKDPTFYGFTLGLVAATVLSVETTHAGEARHKCVEGNSNFPSHVGRGELYLHQGLATAGIVGLGFLMEKMLPADRAQWTKTDKAAHWMYPAMATYGIQFRARDAAKWYGQCW